MLYLLQFRGDVYSGKLLASIPQAEPDCRDSGSSVPSALHCVGSRLHGGAALPEVAGEGASISILFSYFHTSIFQDGPLIFVMFYFRNLIAKTDS